MSKTQKRKKILKSRQKTGDFQKKVAEQKKELDKTVYEKFVAFMNQNRMQKLKERLTYFYGRNFPILYKEKYNFKQRWEDSAKKESSLLPDQFRQDNLAVQIVYTIIMLMNAYLVWSLTVKSFFQSVESFDGIQKSTAVLGIFGRILSVIIKIYTKYSTEFGIGLKLIQLIGLDLVTFVYFVLYSSVLCLDSPPIIVLEVVVVGHLFFQAKRIYKLQGFIHISLRYEYKVKILDSMINLIIVAHFFSLALFASTWNEERNSWIIKIGVHTADYLTKYIYSFYFCSTTILTVGYGDIAPENVREIFVVTLIQFIGVVTFGYLISEIGHTLSAIRKQEENLEKDLRNLGRVQKFYNIDKTLVNKSKGYLVNHDSSLDQLEPSEENQLFGKLNEELRNEIVFERAFSVIKSSIFFICRWSKDLQVLMAAKLQKVLFGPNERLPQPLGNERIYIIKKGKIGVFIKRFGPFNKDQTYLLKRLDISSSKDISENIYGYTAVISAKRCSLDALASDYTSCMYINKQDFEYCVNKSNVDRQYYHQIKTNIDLSEFCQAYEAPSILNIRQHYYPSRTVIIKTKRVADSKLFNDRQRFNRSEFRKNANNYRLQTSIRLRKEIRDKILNRSQEQIDSTPFISGVFDVGKEQSQLEILRKLTLLSQRRQEENNLDSLKELLENNNSRIEEKESMQTMFQKFWEYQNYFTENNLEKVLKRLSRQNYMGNQKQVLKSYKSTSAFCV